MQEDADRTKRGHAPHNLGVLRNLALKILRQSTGAGIAWEQRWRTIAKQPWRAQKLIFPRAAELISRVKPKKAIFERPW